MATAGSILGNSVLRKEDPGLLYGVNDYVDDMKPDTKAIVFVRSNIAHGTINSINIEDGVGMPGVLGMCTSDNTDLPAVPLFAMMTPNLSRPPLAKGKVRFVGDISAMVVAET